MLRTSLRRPLPLALGLLLTFSLPLFAIAVLVALCVMPAHADALVSTSAGAPSWLVTLWSIVEPVVALAVTTLGPIIVGWLMLRLNALLKIKDAAAQKEFEAKVRDALHQSAENGLKAALARAGLPDLAAGVVPQPILAEAIEYVQRMNPDTLKQAKTSLDDVGKIVLSKVPNVAATIAAGKVPVLTELVSGIGDVVVKDAADAVRGAAPAPLNWQQPGNASAPAQTFPAGR